jgi:hypothetical protein
MMLETIRKHGAGIVQFLLFHPQGRYLLLIIASTLVTWLSPRLALPSLGCLVVLLQWVTIQGS